jgi:glutaredoxin
MWSIIVLVILFVITGISIYFVDKLFEENIEIRPEGPIDTIDISTNYILILSMEKCPFCVKLQEDYISKTRKKYSTITYKTDKTFGFDTNFVDIPPEERTNIINGLDKLLHGQVVFPTIIHNKKIIRGLQDKDSLEKIFGD